MTELFVRRRSLPIGFSKLLQALDQARPFAHIQGQRFVQSIDRAVPVARA